MTDYADFTFYSETFRGAAIAQAEFPSLGMQASVVIDQLTFGRAAAAFASGDPAVVAAIRSATCAVADELQAQIESGGAVQTEHVGNFTTTYLSQLSEDARLKRAARRFLGMTDLMFRGLNADER